MIVIFFIIIKNENIFFEFYIVMNKSFIQTGKHFIHAKPIVKESSFVYDKYNKKKGSCRQHERVACMASIIWLIVVAVLLFIEILTLGLTTIWFAGGALAAFIATYLDVNVWGQLLLFIVISLLLLFFTRPVAVRYFNKERVKTNYEGLIGKVVKITERVDNFNQSGAAMVNGQIWTVRTKKDGIIIEPGTKVKIIDIVGVKLIVKEYREEL